MVKTIYNILNMLKGRFLKVSGHAVNWYVVSVGGLRDKIKGKFSGGLGKRQEKLIE